MKWKEVLSLIVVFLIALWYRLWIVRLVPQPFIGDQPEYYGYIAGILKYGLHADTIFLYGYPLLIAPLVAVFGFMNKPWIPFHAILDSATGILVFVLARRLFTGYSRAIPWIALILYAVNPYTSGYVGVLMTEVVAVFLIALVYTMALFFFTRKNVVSVVLLTFLLGFVPQVRPSFFFLSLALAVFIGYVAWTFYPGRRRVITTALIAAFSLPFAYNLITNYVHYRQLAPLFVDNYYACEVYASLLLAKGGPSARTRQAHVPDDIIDVWDRCSAYPTPEGRTRIARYYLYEASGVIAADPMTFIQTAGKKLWFVWEKQFLFPFVVGPSWLDLPVYWGNVLLLISAAVGYTLSLTLHTIRQKHSFMPFHLIVAALVIYITMAHVFSFAAERFSLPAYPILTLYASFTLWKLGSRITAHRRQ